MISIKIQAKIEPKEAIVRLLREKNENMSIKEIADRLELSRPTVSKHCTMLKLEHKIGGIKSGREQIYYTLENQS